MQQVREEARIQWDSIKGILENRLNNSLSVAEGASHPGTTPCNCAFVIEDVQVETPMGHPDFGVEFFSAEECYFSVPFTVQLTTPPEKFVEQSTHLALMTGREDLFLQKGYAILIVRYRHFLSSLFMLLFFG